VDWIWDNAVLLAFLVGLAAALIGLALLGLRAWGAWRALRGATRSLGAAGQALAADAARVSAAVSALPQRQAEVQAAIETLRFRAQALGVLSRHVVLAQRVLLGPLRYLGR
jgi:hypothetical protein